MLYPNIDYTKLTADNFIVGLTSLSSGTASPYFNMATKNGQVTSHGVTLNTSFLKQYDSSTGILTISTSLEATMAFNGSGYDYGSNSSYISGSVGYQSYLIV